MANDRWVLLQLMHHLVDDNTSLRFLHAEIQAHLQGRAHELPAPLPFRNYVAQSRLGVSREAHEAYFRALLADVDEPTARLRAAGRVAGRGSRRHGWWSTKRSGGGCGRGRRRWG